MITVDSLSLWIRENTTLADSSVYKYAHGVSTISKEMLAKGVIPVDLFSMSSLQYEIYLPQILNDPDFKIKNTTGNSMYSNALKQYRLFRTANPEDEISQNEINAVVGDKKILSETERAALIKARIGQGAFRHSLMEKYNSTCIITGITSGKILIASHIKPWAVSTNEERLSEENGVLLSPTYDKLFDYGLITFTNDGSLRVSSQIPRPDGVKLDLFSNRKYDLKASAKTREYLEYHRDVIFVR